MGLKIKVFSHKTLYATLNLFQDPWGAESIGMTIY
ncbi:MAG: hypothetical protein K0S53_1814 [Bacteroidetes bacterium]|jgi:hypothetical protein|nr:hypothetical protein [Bacteroidota bacterium]MDF2451490.1 hypothetical protein [Bacteroidota bacterium]